MDATHFFILSSNTLFSCFIAYILIKFLISYFEHKLDKILEKLESIERYVAKLEGIESFLLNELRHKLEKE